MQKVNEENKKIENDILRRQNRYIMREQDYRLQIEELQGQLRIRLDNDEDTGEDNPNKPKTKMHPVIDKLRGQFKRSVDNIKPKLEKLKQEQQSDIIRKFNSEMLKMKKRLEEQKSFKGD